VVVDVDDDRLLGAAGDDHLHRLGVAGVLLPVDDPGGMNTKSPARASRTSSSRSPTHQRVTPLMTKIAVSDPPWWCTPILPTGSSTA
jgi:hypothetical protein